MGNKTGLSAIAELLVQGKVRTAVKIGGQFYCSFVANLLKYQCAKNYEIIMRFDKIIAKIKRCNFFAPHSLTHSLLRLTS